VARTGHGLKIEMRARFLWMLIVAWVAASSAWALDPTKRLSQYAHTSWRSRDGYFGGSYPSSIAQTQDGFIWIGTTSGLIRFDGVRFTQWSPPDGQPLPLPIYCLVAARDGSLWIGSQGSVAHWASGRLTRYAAGPFSVLAILERRDGTIWFTRVGGGKPGGLCRLERGASQCYGASDGIEGLGTDALAEDGAGNLWIGGDASVVRWTPTAHVAYPLPQLLSVIGSGVAALEPAPDEGVWVGMENVSGRELGLQRLAAGRMQPVVAGKLDGSTLPVFTLHYDGSGSLWVGTENQGIYRIHGETVDQFRSVDGLSGDHVWKFLEDREGTLWVATTRGLDAFHDRGVVTLSTREGLGLDQVDSVLAARDGTVWVGGPQGLDAIRSAGVTSIHLPGSDVTSVFEDHTGTLWVGINNTLTFRNQGRFEPIDIPDPDPKGIVTSLTEDVNGNVWAEVRGTPSKLIRIQDRRVREVFVEPRVPAATRLAADPEGGVWLGLRSGNLARFRNGVVETFLFEHDSAAAHPAPIAQLSVGHDGSVLAAATFGLLGWHQGTRRLMTVSNGLPCDKIDAVVEDDHATVWLATPCGLLGLAPEEVNAWWRNPEVTVHPRILDSLDGWEPGEVSFQPAARSIDGRLWFANQSAVQVIDPDRLPHNTLPPPVQIEGIVADRKEFRPAVSLRLPPLTRDLQISYTALSLVAPQKVRFRYRLEGHDTDWQDATTRRQAFYNDLPPGDYSFRVIACNNDGVWNEAGASISLTIAPAWYQAKLFRAACLAFGILALWALYRLRVHQIKAAAATRFNERLAERTRVARDIHDTLLQTIQGSKMVTEDALEHAAEPGRLRTAIEQLDNFLARATREGRAALNSLRATSAEGHDLMETLKRVAEEETGAGSLSVTCTSTGEPRDIHPIVADEVFRIAHEAVRNARMHAQASKLLVELEFGERLIFRITDDGMGMDSALLEHGRPGHFGLQGMRERAAHAEGKLTITSAPGAGTVITLIVPGGIAFQTEKTMLFSRLRASFGQHRSGEDIRGKNRTN
jgi:signal transduction histidine kinase/ligand-binding sensor domain-containing protein